jgi:hypothetical protein
VLAFVAGAAACASFGGARPAWAPLPDAEVFTSPWSPEEVLTFLQDSLAARGFAIQLIVPPEGYLETRWFDVAARQAAAEPFSGADSVVKLRFFADPVGLHTRVIAEAVRRTAWDPSRPARELEAMLPPEHPGRLLMDSLLALVPRGSRTPEAVSTPLSGPR